MKKQLLNHAIFWILMYSFLAFPTLGYQEMKLAYLCAHGIKIIPQMMVAYIMIYVLVPRVLNQYGKILFGLSTISILYVAFVLYVVFRVYIFEPTFPEFYKVPPGVDLDWRATDFHYFARNVIWFLLPAVILMSVQYYKKEKETLVLKEQKKSAELSALRNQLNPHFLFNTLNNLYTLALKKSDQTPEVIARLSEILDYILYRCNEQFVPIEREVALLENYISLEKVRYGKRVDIEFEKHIESELEIAPLLLLTFLENAFKHGVSQEIKKANIQLNLKSYNDTIEFTLVNTISAYKSDTKNNEGIGLPNVRKQLDLLYSSRYELNTSQTDDKFMVYLKITTS